VRLIQMAIEVLFAVATPALARRVGGPAARPSP
jgi:hypothetical protein